MAKAAPATKPESKQLDFDSMIDSFLASYVPPRKGRDETPELKAVKENYASIKKAVDAGVPFKAIAPLLSKATGLEFTEAKVRSQWSSEARKRGDKELPKKREAKEASKTT